MTPLPSDEYSAEEGFRKRSCRCKRRMGIVEEKFSRDNSRPGSFIVAAYGVLIYAVRTKRIDDYDEAYFKLKSLSAQFSKMSDRDRIALFYYSAIPELSLLNETLDMERGKIPTQQKIILLFFIAIFILSAVILMKRLFGLAG